MSEATLSGIIIAFIVTLPSLLAQVVLFVQGIRNARKLDENTVLTDVLVQKQDNTEKKVDVVSVAVVEVSKKTDDQTLKIDEVFTKAEVIAGHVNSEKTAGLGREATYAAENKLLREMMVVLERAVASIAQASAVASVAQARPTIQILEQIEKDEGQIETNTAKIEAKVEALKSEGR